MHRILKDPLQCWNNANEDGYAEGGTYEGDDDMLAINANYIIDAFA
jgi:hypothetical protein